MKRGKPTHEQGKGGAPDPDQCDLGRIYQKTGCRNPMVTTIAGVKVCRVCLAKVNAIETDAAKRERRAPELVPVPPTR